ncbi:MAG: hypothetical protein K2P78_08100 [Gemmataceae bacterium]|nr:hypothetical protein [Gemmataceae bacterium]
MLPPVLLAAFPDLDADGGVVTHPPDPAYNCVAWAAGVTDAVWWPADPDGYWPPGVPDELTVDAVVAALATTVGYAPCPDGGYEPGFEKAAVYARGGVPTHVARQLAGGRWSSKLGRDCTVSHATPGGVEGAVYGSAAAFLRRPAP